MEYNNLPTSESIERTVKALKARGIAVEFVENREKALGKIMELIPIGKEIMTGSSVTLEEIGFIPLLKSKKHPWKNMKDEILAEKDGKKQSELRKKVSYANIFWEVSMPYPKQWRLLLPALPAASFLLMYFRVKMLSGSWGRKKLFRLWKGR